jgi:bifunctional enzyme CysN/CysC
VIRPDLDTRAYAGTIASGIIRRGDEVMVLPSLRRSRIKAITTWDGDLAEAFAPMAVAVALEDDVDVSRGDMLVHINNVPRLEQEIEAMVVWMHERPLEAGQHYLLKQTTVQTPATISAVRYKIDVNTMRREPTDGLRLNEIGRLRLETPRVLAVDPYAVNPSTGAFILIDRISNATLAAGMILDRDPAEVVTTRRAAPDAGTNLRSRAGGISTAVRAERLQQTPFVIWLTGLPRSGKSSVAYELEKRLFDSRYTAHVLDGENLRRRISADLGFSTFDRKEAVRRAAELAALTSDLGLISVVAVVSPTNEDRALARAIVAPHEFIEVFCNAPLDVCELRDEDDLFARARRGEVKNVTGIDLPYEPPATADLVLDTAAETSGANVEHILELLRKRKLIG